MNKETPRIVDFYIQFRGGKGDWITSPDNKKDYEKALKLTQDFMRKNKIKTKLETGTPEQGSSAYKISLILNKKKPEYRVDLRPLVDQISKFKTAEDHGGGYDKPLKEFRMPPMTVANEGKKFDKAYDAWHKSTVQLTKALEKEAGNKIGVSKFKKALQNIENAIDWSQVKEEDKLDEAAKLTNITRTHKGIEYRNVGSSIHQAFWDGYDNVKSRKGTILFSVWKEGRAAANQGLYRGVSKLKPPHAKKALQDTENAIDGAELEEAPLVMDKMKSFKEYSDAFEALTISQRQKRKAAFRKNKAKIMIARKKAAKKLASPEKLKQRAIVQARNIIIKKILKNKGKAELSFAAKAELEKKVKKKTGAIKKIAKKLLPQIKQAEKARLKNRKTPDQ